MDKKIQSDLERRLEDKHFAEEYGENIAKAEIAVTVSQARRSRRLKQEDLAKRLDANQSYVAKLESGDANPTVGNVGRILAKMGLRLVAGVGTLSSRIEEKGVLVYSASADNIVINWVSGAVLGSAVLGSTVSAAAVASCGWAVSSNIIFVDENSRYIYHGAALSNPAVSGVSGFGEYLNTIWEASPEENSIKLTLKGAK